MKKNQQLEKEREREGERGERSLPKDKKKGERESERVFNEKGFAIYLFI